ncbi:MAG: hypothetical protein V1906_01700 [Candidatus Woesearchaeota archaeon]
MDKKRKLTCDCGNILVETEKDFDGVISEAMVCPKCHFTTLTKDQFEKLIELKKLHEVIDKERRIIKIGNSLGITLPESLRDFGITVGKKVKIEALTRRSLKISF